MKLSKNLCALFFLCLALPAAARWVPIGPSTVISGGADFSTLVRAVAFHPAEPGTIFAGTATGGVWRSRDVGQSWTPLTDHECSLSISSLAIDPSDPLIVYAGTGRAFPSLGEEACGILRSTDGGDTWEQLPASVFLYTQGNSAPAPAAVLDLVVDLRPPGRLLAATAVGLYLSEDHGESFTLVLGPLNGKGQVWDLVRHPTNPDVLYAAAESQVLHGAQRSSVFKSADGGRTWQEVAKGLPLSGVDPTKLAIAPSSPNILYALIGGNFLKARLFRTEDAGATWTETVPGADLLCACPAGPALLVSLTNPKQLFFGGDRFQTSFDSGKHWQTPPTGQLEYQALAFDSAKRLWAGSSFGLFWTTTNGRSWNNANHSLGATALVSVTPHPTEPATVYAGSLTLGILRTTGSPEWGTYAGGPGGRVLYSPDGKTMYFSYHSALFLGSDNGGLSIFDKSPDLPTGGYSDFPAPVAFSAGDPDVVFLGGQEVFRSENRGDSWESIGNRLQNSEVFTALGTGPGPQGELIWAGTSSGRVWLTDSGGLAWVDRSAGLPSRPLTDLKVEGQTAYATFSGSGASVFKTNDAGLTWASLSAELPAMGVNRILVLPDALVIAADLGVYVSYDDGATWTEDRSGLPNSPVVDVAMAPDGRMLAATYGRGVYVAPGLPEAGPPALRLGADDRFEVTVTWKTETGVGAGQPVRLTDDTGVFWFFDDQNLELVVKMLDGCAVSGRHWFFAGGLTNVEVSITVRDRATGEIRTYHQDGGRPFEPIQDTGAFDGCGSPAAAIQPAIAPSAPDCVGAVLCLGEGDRFRVTATWETLFGDFGPGQAVRLTSDTGYFYFFDAANVELLIKTVDGCGTNGHHWVFAGGLTNVEVVLRVFDTHTEQVREYRNPMAQRFQPIQDTEAFGVCQ